VKPSTGPLAGLRVLEVTQIMSGPTCGLLLADMGADVIKIEKLQGGDDARGYRDPQVGGVSAPFMMMNRNKRGLALDLKSPKGRALLLKMAKNADVLVENFRGGTMDKLGLGYEALKAENPGLIYCAITGYGRTGPYADKGGFDLIAQGFAGLMSVTGEAGRPPAKSGSAVSDMNAGILAALGILAAYIHKLKTGEGQVVDTSLSDAALQQTYWHAAVWFATQKSPSSPRPTRRLKPATAGSTSAAPTRPTGNASATCWATPNGRATRDLPPTATAWRTWRCWWT